MASVYNRVKVKVKVKFALEQATKAQRVSNSITLPFFNLGDRWIWVVDATPLPLYPRERPDTRRVYSRFRNSFQYLVARNGISREIWINVVQNLTLYFSCIIL